MFVNMNKITYISRLDPIVMLKQICFKDAKVHNKNDWKE